MDESIKNIRKNVLLYAKRNLIAIVRVGGIVENKFIEFTSTGIKEAINQPHKHYILKCLAILDIEFKIRNAEYVCFVEDTTGRCLGFHYLKTQIANEDSYIVIKHNFNESVVFYTIVDALKT